MRKYGMLITIAIKPITGCIYIAVDSEWSEWTAWCFCSVTCGGGTMYRHRECHAHPDPDCQGADCDYTPSGDEDSADCNTQCCPGQFRAATQPYLGGIFLIYAWLEGVMVSSRTADLGVWDLIPICDNCWVIPHILCEWLNKNVS
jgi:hypothetical protein